MSSPVALPSSAALRAAKVLPVPVPKFSCDLLLIDYKRSNSTQVCTAWVRQDKLQTQQDPRTRP
jgi:hypothetical protein